MDRIQKPQETMTCSVCSSDEYRERLIRYSLDYDGRLVVIENVPARVCDRCGEVSVAPEVVDRLQRTVWSNERPHRTVETQVYEYA